jgi:histidinol-phosphate aminotransferase
MSKDPASLVREEIRALAPYHVAPAHGMVKLDAMENPYALPEALAAEMGARLAKVAVNRYPDPTAPALKRRLREAMAIPDSLEIVLGNGSDEILQVIAMALARPGAVALAPEPSFAMYRMSAVACGLRYVGVALRPDFNNPTGNLFAREAILRIVEASPGLVVVDEAYYAFSGGATLLPEVGRHPNLLLVRTVSKLGLAGLRLGLAIGTRDWAAELEKLRLPYNVNVLSMAAAELLLEHRDVLEGQTRAIVAERARLEAALDRIGAARFPSAANFVLVRVRDAPRAFGRLKDRGILVRSFHGSHPLLEHCLRLTVGTPAENDRLVEALVPAIA